MTRKLYFYSGFVSFFSRSKLSRMDDMHWLAIMKQKKVEIELDADDED